MLFLHRTSSSATSAQVKKAQPSHELLCKSDLCSAQKTHHGGENRVRVGVRCLGVLTDVEMLKCLLLSMHGEGKGGFSPCIDPRAGSQQENNKHLFCQCLLSPAVGQATLQSQPQQQNIYGHSWKEWIIISQPCCSIYKPFCRRCSENGERCCCKAAVKSHLQLELLRIFT